VRGALRPSAAGTFGTRAFPLRRGGSGEEGDEPEAVMVYRVAINGFGRIGRCFVRAALERGTLNHDVEIVAVNDVWPATTLASLLSNDSTYGRLRVPVETGPDGLSVGGRLIRVFDERDPAELPWKELDVDLVIEATGRLRTRDDAAAHLRAGAAKVLLSAPGKRVDATVVLGVSAEEATGPSYEIVSAGSCTTNCAAPMADVLHRTFGVDRGSLTTVHSYTNDQVLLDGAHKDPRRARSAAVNIIPTTTGAAKALGDVLPQLAGKFSGLALRVPVENGSMTILTVKLHRAVTVEEVNAAFRAASIGQLKGILRCSDEALVSRDIIGDPASCIFDCALTQAEGDLATVYGWYDNEWGYTNRLLDLTELYAAATPTDAR
jgi:glyceraldehyde 3-phosphate dehydrogenase